MKSPRIPLDDSWDVIVAGGGPAGCAAAAAAAREGAKTILIEATGALGGMGTSGLVPAWCPFSDSEKIIYRGLAERVFTACKQGMPHVPKEALDWVAIDPECLKHVYDDLLAEYGARVLFFTTLCAVEMASDDTVEALIVANKAGLSAFRAKVYVDCTGDADLAAWAGASFEKGDDSGETMPVTHCFILSNVDEDAFRHGPPIYGGNPASPLYQILASGKYPAIKDSHLCCNLIGPGTVGFNAGHQWDVDGLAPFRLSEAMAEGRRIAAALRDGLAEYHPAAFTNAFLAATAPLLGVRESRRILGDYVLTIEDYRARRSFPDEISRNCYHIDIHTSKAEIGESLKGEQHLLKRCEFYGKGESHGIPYRCLTPRGLRNVLVAGRAISCDRLMQGSVRIMPSCLAMGEAAGLAAAMAGRANNNIRGFPVTDLQQRLKALGAYLPHCS